MAAIFPVEVEDIDQSEDELKKVERTLDSIISGINEAWERANQFFTMVTKKRDDLIKKCNAYKEEFRAEMRKIKELQTVKVSVSSAKDSIGKGAGTVLEGQTLFVHDSLHGRLQDFLANAKREDSEKAKEIARRVACLSFTPYKLDSEHVLGELSVNNQGCLEKRLDGGDEPSLNQWRLEYVGDLSISGRDPRCLAASYDGLLAVGFYGGGVEVHRVGELYQGRESPWFGMHIRSQSKVRGLNTDAQIQCVALLGDGSYVVRKSSGRISLYSSRTSERIKKAKFDETIDPYGGLDVDGCDRIYAGCSDEDRVDVFTPKGGDSIRWVSSWGCKPHTVCTMNHSDALVLSDGYIVRVVNQHSRKNVMHEVTNKGFGACVAVLHDDNILIGWCKAGQMNIDLYTNRLKLVRRVLADYKGYVYAIREVSTGEIAVCARSKVQIFRQTRA